MTRPATPDVIRNGRRTVTVKRICDGCGVALGDATNEELEAAILGRLPSVITEHGCQRDPVLTLACRLDIDHEDCAGEIWLGSIFGQSTKCDCACHPPIEKIEPAATPQ